MGVWVFSCVFTKIQTGEADFNLPLTESHEDYDEEKKGPSIQRLLYQVVLRTPPIHCLSVLHTHTLFLSHRPPVPNEATTLSSSCIGSGYRFNS